VDLGLTDGSDLIPARSIAMTKGEEAPVPSLRFRPSEFEGVKIPMMNVPIM